jgi:hypothetical protein
VKELAPPLRIAPHCDLRGFYHQEA